MKKSKIYSGISGLALLLLALVVSACGDSTPTASPSNAVAATATSSPATTLPATAVTTPAAQTTVATTQAVPTATSQPTARPTTAATQTIQPTAKLTTSAPTTKPPTTAPKTTQPASKVNDADKAIELLANQLTQDKIYSKNALNCLSFALDKESQTYFDLDLMEKHGNGCPGDPNTAPVVDRFRVYRANGAIQWYNLISDQYLAYEQYKLSRQGQ